MGRSMFFQKIIYLFIAAALGQCLHVQGVELLFLPNKTVFQESRLKLEVQQSLPIGKIHTAMEQDLAADVKLVDRSNLPISRPPIHMIFTLKDLFVRLRANDKEVEYQVNKPNTSLFLAEIRDMIDKPIKLDFDEEFHLLPDTPGLVQLSKELPILSQIHPQSLAEELFHYPFALAGQSLEVNRSYDIPFAKGVGLQPKVMTYTVTEINDEEIVAQMKGDIPSSTFDMQIEIPLGESMQDSIRLVMSGGVAGEVRWNRSNALIYALNTKTNYRGSYQIAGKKSIVEIELTHKVEAREANGS